MKSEAISADVHTSLRMEISATPVLWVLMASMSMPDKHQRKLEPLSLGSRNILFIPGQDSGEEAVQEQQATRHDGTRL